MTTTILPGCNFSGKIIIDEATQNRITQTPSVHASATHDQYSSFHPRVAALLRRSDRIMQHTDEWHTKRKQMLTATNVASILGESKWESSEKLFQRKTGRGTPTMKTAAMQHGIDTEAFALEAFEEFTGLQLFKGDVGLVQHGTFPWIGASPDGVCRYFPFLVEIKCPQSVPQHLCPKQYYHQIQLQLEVCDLDGCFLAQYIPTNLPLNYGHLDIVYVSRNHSWWTRTFLKMAMFWERVKRFYESTDEPVSEIQNQYDEHVFKKRKIVEETNAECMLVDVQEEDDVVCDLVDEVDISYTHGC